MARPAVIVALPPNESIARLRRARSSPASRSSRSSIRDELEKAPRRAGVTSAGHPRRRDRRRASAREYEAALRNAGRPIAALTVVSPRALRAADGPGPVGRPATSTSPGPTRPSPSAGGSRRCASGARPSTTAAARSSRAARSASAAGTAAATTIAVFNPKGGVGKTTVATNLASTLQTRKGKSVLLIDADTVTGHVTTSLGIDAVRTVVDSWRDEAEGGPSETLLDIASAHPSGMRVVAADRLAAPHRHPRPGPAGRGHRRRAGRASTSSSSTCTRRTARSTRRSSTRPTGSSCRSPRTCRRSAPPSSCATSRAGSAAASAWRWSSTAPTAASPSRTWSGPSGCRPWRSDPVRRPALRAGRQRGPDGDRDVPEGEDHRRLRRPRRPRARDPRRPSRSKTAGFRIPTRTKEPARA